MRESGCRPRASAACLRSLCAQLSYGLCARSAACSITGRNSGGSEASPWQCGFHQPVDLPCFKRRGTIVGRAGFKRVQPFRCFGNTSHDYKGQCGPFCPYSAQQGQVLRRLATGKYDIHVRQIAQSYILRLLFNAMPLDSQSTADLGGSRLFKANEKYVRHASFALLFLGNFVNFSAWRFCTAWFGQYHLNYNPNVARSEDEIQLMFNGEHRPFYIVYGCLQFFK